MASFPPYQRDARSKGIPQLGAGAIYPVPESDIFIDPIPLKPWWRRAYGLDVGWNKTAAVWLAYDSDADVAYITHEYERSMAEPSVHAGAIRLRGKWIPGVIDPASRGRAPKDGEQLLGLYQNLGLHLSLANNAVEAGLFTVFQRMTSGRLKIFNNCIGVQREFRIYRRDERGHVVKSNDHLMDACFAAGTKVETDRGAIAIEELVGTTGNVRSFGGAYVPYEWCGLTRRAEPVVRVSFDRGREIVCTPDHLFWTDKGWCEARHLGWNPSVAEFSWCSMRMAQVLGIEALPEPRDVYCLSVPGVEAFCVEGGLVVHNCRYVVMSGIAAARMAPDAGDQFRRSFRPANSNLARSDYNPFEEVT